MSNFGLIRWIMLLSSGRSLFIREKWFAWKSNGTFGEINPDSRHWNGREPATWLGNVLMDVKISKLPEFPICGQRRGIVRSFETAFQKLTCSICSIWFSSKISGQISVKWKAPGRIIRTEIWLSFFTFLTFLTHWHCDWWADFPTGYCPIAIDSRCLQF